MSAKSQKDTSIQGSSAYKRQQIDSQVILRQTSNMASAQRGTQNQSLISKFNQSGIKALHDVKRQAATSINKPINKIEQKTKKITDISELFTNQSRNNFTSNAIKSTLLKSLSDSEMKIKVESCSPFSAKKQNYNLSKSPQATFLDEPQMILRSGTSASMSSNENQRDSFGVTLQDSSTFKLISNHEKCQSSISNKQLNSPNGMKLFNDSQIKMASNIKFNEQNLQSTSKFGLRLSINKSAQAQNKSPSVCEIQGALKNFPLNISDITRAFNEIADGNESDDSDLRLSPLEQQQQEDFQNTILNSSNNPLSTGLQSHDFSMAASSGRNSLGFDDLQKPKSPFVKLLKNILIEGQVFWQIQWAQDSKDNLMREPISFELQDDMIDKYPKEFNQIMDKFYEERQQTGV